MAIWKGANVVARSPTITTVSFAQVRNLDFLLQQSYDTRLTTLWVPVSCNRPFFFLVLSWELVLYVVARARAKTSVDVFSDEFFPDDICCLICFLFFGYIGTPLGKYPYTEGWNLLDMTSLLNLYSYLRR